MSYVFIYVLLPLTAVLVDILVSYILLPRLSIFGKPSRDESQQDVATFLFALQNDESHTVEVGREAIQVVLSTRSDYAFSPERPITVCRGPGDEITGRWRSPRRNELVLEIPRIRPLKTWLLRVRVDRRVNGMRMELRVPTRSLLRRLLQRINEHTFMFSDLGYSATKIDVRDESSRRTTTSTWRRALRGLLPMICVSLMVYGVFVDRVLVDKRDRYADIAALGGDRNELQLKYLWLDGVCYGLGLWLIYLMARTRPNPIAQGYQTVEKLEIKEDSTLLGQCVGEHGPLPPHG